MSLNDLSPELFNEDAEMKEGEKLSALYCFKIDVHWI